MNLLGYDLEVAFGKVEAFFFLSDNKTILRFFLFLVTLLLVSETEDICSLINDELLEASFDFVILDEFGAPVMVCPISILFRLVLFRCRNLRSLSV